MSKITDLAELLERSAKALREADAIFKALPSPGRPLRDLPGYKELSVRAMKCLYRANSHMEVPSIITVEHLCSQTEADLLCRKNLGPTTLLEIKEWLKRNNLALANRQQEAPQ